MQIDGYSLDAQKARMKAYADFNDYQIVGEYEDAGKSGKSIEGCAFFCRMMEDIKSGKDVVAYVLVFKLSRFGRNVADVLSTLQVMQDFGVNLICVEDGIDSSKDAGKLIISVLSAVAEIERENIHVQTMEGRTYKVLICFEKLYNVMNPLERKKLMEHLISEIQIYPERRSKGQWLKSIKFRLPIVENDIDLCLDNESHTECVIALSKGEIDSKKVRVEFSLEGMDTSGLQKGATYPEIKARVLEQTGLKVSSLYISQVKQKCGLEVRENHHKAKSENTKQPQCPKEKEDAIVEALKHFQMI